MEEPSCDPVLNTFCELSLSVFSSTSELGTIIIPKLQVKKLKLREIQEPRQSNSGTKACDWVVRCVSNAQSEAGLRLRGRTS